MKLSKYISTLTYHEHDTIRDTNIDKPCSTRKVKLVNILTKPQHLSFHFLSTHFPDT